MEHLNQQNNLVYLRDAQRSQKQSPIMIISFNTKGSPRFVEIIISLSSGIAPNSGTLKPPERHEPTSCHFFESYLNEHD
jgi:hypothetical protein